MLAIPLPNGEHTCVDEKYFDELSKYKLFLKNGYVTAYISGKNVSMSRFITKAEKGKVVDHINGNRLINTESNLRTCTPSQNSQNIPITLLRERPCPSGRGWIAQGLLYPSST